MGSKKLKAIAVRGRQRVPLADKEAFSQTAKQAVKIVLDDIQTQVYRELGTASFVDMSMMWGNLPNKYWTQPEFEEATELSGCILAETILIRPMPCYGCAVACGRQVTLKDTPYGIDVVDGPEYETVGALGSLLLVDDLLGVTYANHLCNRFGLDTISVGSSIAFACLLYERGLITADDTGGLPLHWGDIETVHTLLEMIARRQGFGDVLADGVELIGARYGAEDLAVHVNGLDPPAQDPRALSGMGLVYATSPRGACHMQGDMYAVNWGLSFAEIGILPGDRFATEGKAVTVARLEDWRTLYNSAIMCSFVNPTVPILGKLLGEATGQSPDPAHWLRTGERIFDLKRAFNNRLGVDRNNDRLPGLLLVPMDNGSEGHVPQMDVLLRDYYADRDWDWNTGRPSRTRLIELGLPDIAEELWP
jgi:aldehyde:ferredoxin oxidoreductase